MIVLVYFRCSVVWLLVYSDYRNDRDGSYDIYAKEVPKKREREGRRGAFLLSQVKGQPRSDSIVSTIIVSKGLRIDGHGLASPRTTAAWLSAYFDDGGIASVRHTLGLMIKKKKNGASYKGGFGSDVGFFGKMLSYVGYFFILLLYYCRCAGGLILMFLTNFKPTFINLLIYFCEIKEPSDNEKKIERYFNFQ